MTVEGQEYYATTAYFLDPEKICTTGRTQEEFDIQGTLGGGLWFQKGQELFKAPLTEEGALAEVGSQKKNLALLRSTSLFFLL